MYKALTPTALSLILCASLATTEASANVTITSFDITANSITLNIAGTLPGNTPQSSAAVLFLVNADYSAGYVFGQSGSNWASTVNFSGDQTLQSIVTSQQTFGDYLFMIFTTSLVSNATFSGTITGSWTSDILHPELLPDLSNVQLYWGTAASGAITSGILLTDLAPVPEPSTVALIGAGAAAALVLAVRRRNNKA